MKKLIAWIIDVVAEMLFRMGLAKKKTGTQSLTVEDKQKLKYFKDHEVSGLDPVFTYRLDVARNKAGVPFVITSGFRSPEQNSLIGGSPNSSHLKGLAVDLNVVDSLHRFYVVKGLIETGFNRIGIYDRHVHVDVDPDKPQDVIWTGKSK